MDDDKGIDNVEIKKNIIKIAYIIKFRDKSIQPPIFPENVSNPINEILGNFDYLIERIKYENNEIEFSMDKKIDSFNSQELEQIKLNMYYQRKTYSDLAQHLPKLRELIHQNNLIDAFLQFQTKINIILGAVKHFILKNQSEHNKSVNLIFDKLVASMCSINFSKLPLESLRNINELLSNLKKEISSIKTKTNKIQEALTIVNEGNKLIKSIYLAKWTISLFESITFESQVSQKNNSSKTKILVKPLKLNLCLTPNSESDYLLSDLKKKIEDISNQLKNDDNIDASKKNDYILLFKNTLNSNIKFYSPVFILMDVLNAVSSLDIKNKAIDSKSFFKIANFFDSLSSAIQIFYCLPKVIKGSSEISTFITQVKKFNISKNSLENILIKIDQQKYQSSFKAFSLLISYFKYIISIGEIIDIINNSIKKQIVSIDLSILKPSSPTYEFLIIDYVKNEKLNKINIFRSLNIINNNAEALQHLGINIYRDHNSNAVYPLSFSDYLKRVNESIFNLKKIVFENNDIEIKGSNINLVTFLSEFQKEIQNLPFSINAIPLLALRIKTFSFLQDNLEIDPNPCLNLIFQLYSMLYCSYSLFCNLDHIGSVPLNASIHLSFLLTLCSELSELNPAYQSFQEYFSKVNLFQIHFRELFSIITCLKNQTEKILSTQLPINIKDILNQISSHSEYMKLILSFIKEKLSNDSTINRAKDINEFISNLSTLHAKALKKSTIIDYSIKIELLGEKISNKKHELAKYKIDYSEYIKIIKLFRKLRLSFEQKSLANHLLNFLELLQLNQIDINGCPDINETHHTILSLQDDKFLDHERISDKELDIFYEFFDKQTNKSTPRSILYMISPQLLHHHFITIINRLSLLWDSDISTSKIANELFGEMINLSFESTPQGILQFFASNNDKCYGYFNAIKPILDSYIDKLLKSLHELLQTKNHVKELGQQFSEIHKNIQSIKAKISYEKINWIQNIISIYFQLTQFDFGNIESISLLFELRKTYRIVFYFYIIWRYFNFYNLNYVPNEYDRTIIQYLNDECISKMKVKKSSFSYKTQIDQILKSDIGSDPGVLYQGLKHLKKTLMLFNLGNLVNVLTNDFFDFGSFFSEIPSSLSNFFLLINSSLFNSACFSKKKLFEFFINDPSDSSIYSIISALNLFKKEVSSAPFKVDTSSIDNTLLSCKLLLNIYDIGVVLDCLDSFTPKKYSKYVSGILLLNIRLLIQYLNSRLSKIATILQDDFLISLQKFSKCYISILQIKNIFCYIDGNSKKFQDFIHLWSDFCSTLKPFNISEQYSSFIFLTKSLFDVLNPNQNTDIHALYALTQLYLVSNDPQIIYKLKLSYLFICSQIQRYNKDYEMNQTILPFYEIIEKLEFFGNFYEAFSIIKRITYLINNTNCQEEITLPDTFSIFSFNKNEDISSNENYGDKEENLSIHNLMGIEDQTLLGQKINSLLHANQNDNERFASFPLLQYEVDKIRPKVHKLNDEVNTLNKLHDNLSLFYSATKKHQEEEKEKKKVIASNISNNNEMNKFIKIKHDINMTTEEINNLLNRYEKAYKFSQDIDEDIKLTSSDVTMLQEKQEFLKRAKSVNKYINELSLVSNAKDYFNNAHKQMCKVDNYFRQSVKETIHGFE